MTTEKPTAHERLRELEFFVGGWDAAGVFHETPFGPRKPIGMRIQAAAEHRGFWITLNTAELPTPENPAPADRPLRMGLRPGHGRVRRRLVRQ